MEEKENKKIGMVEIESIKDLIHLIVRIPFQIINHIKISKKYLYFVLLGSGLPGFSTVMYYVLLDEKVDANYIIYNSMKDEITYASTFENLGRGGIMYIPIINIKKQNLIKDELFDF